MCDTYDITYSDLNPTLYFAGKHSVTASGKPHNHNDATELMFALNGSIRVFVENRFFLLHPGDIIVIPPHTEHYCTYADSNDPGILFFTAFSNYHFKGMEPNRLQLPSPDNILPTEGLTRQEITNICLKMLGERYSNQIGQYFMQKTYLIQLLLLIIRQIRKPEPTCCDSCHFEVPHKTYVVSEIQQYLIEHYEEKISLDLIAKNMYLSSAYISKIFKEEIGEAPINYLIKLRLEHAKKALEENPDASIKSISNSVGYEDVYYFSKLFKKYFGQSPQNYRKRATPAGM